MNFNNRMSFQGENVPHTCVKLEELYENDGDVLTNVQSDDVALLPYSSGTVGLSKGVQLTHNNVVSNLYQMSAPEFRIHLETDGNTFQLIS